MKKKISKVFGLRYIKKTEIKRNIVGNKDTEGDVVLIEKTCMPIGSVNSLNGGIDIIVE